MSDSQDTKDKEYEDRLRQALLAVTGGAIEKMRYGENDGQHGWLIRQQTRPGAATATLLQGKPMSYNNVADADAAFECVAEFDPARTAAVIIVKHGNPCGAAEGSTPRSAYAKALACDPISAYGGIVACNRNINGELARAIVQRFTEVVIAPNVTEEASEVLASKKDLRVLLTGSVPDPRQERILFKSVAGGLLAQTADNRVVDDMDLRVVTKRQPTEQELVDMKFAYRVVKHVKSNAIVYAHGGVTLGVGAGQMSRIDSCRLGVMKYHAVQPDEIPFDFSPGTVMASDAFFPKTDALETAIKAGVAAVIQPGGSKQDDEVIAVADTAGIAMVFTGVRHFRH